MKQLIFTLIFFLKFTLNTASAHQDFYVTKDYGNIKVRVKTGFVYEEINKAFIIGQLAEKLAKSLNYSEPIFLDFDHYYVGYCIPDYFISFDKGAIKHTWFGSSQKEKAFFRKAAIVIRQVSSKFDADVTLKLLEYSIKNLSNIKKGQKTIEYNKNYCQWEINSIDTVLIKTQLDIKNSSLLDSILKLKVAPPEKEFKSGISYFWQDNKFYFYLRDKRETDTILLKLDNVFVFVKEDNSHALVFDTDSSFYYLNQFDKTIISKRHVIIQTNNNFQPFKIDNLGKTKISIRFWFYPKEEEQKTRERTLIYLTEKDELLQDLNSPVEKK